MDPDSKLAAVQWFGRTALPELLGLAMARFNNTRIHRVLSALEACDESLQTRLATAVSDHRGPFSLLFLDVTDTWFVGRGPSLATKGKTKEGLHRRKVNIALLCDELGHPLRWKLIEGRRHDSVPMKEMAWALQSVDWAAGVPLVLDRAMGATAHIQELLSADRPFITALTRTEFDTYTDRVPTQSLSEVPWRSSDASRQAALAVTSAGMEPICDTLCVLDLGVVTRNEAEASVGQMQPVTGTDKCRQRMEIARVMKAAMDSGEARSLAEAGQPHGLGISMTSRTLRWLRLAPDIQQDVLAGEAAPLSLRTMAGLNRIEDFEAQRQTFQQALALASAQPDKRRTRPAGPLHAVPRSTPPDTSPTRLRAVLAFNPELWVRQKQARDHLLVELRSWSRRRNDNARDPRSRMTAAKLRHAALARLARNHLVEACEVDVTTQQVDGRDVHQVQIKPDPKAWDHRQRFFGFQLIVARPDDTRAAADLVSIYRAKDKVEKDFQTIKSVLSLRPVRHRTDAKVRAHVTLCMLALLVERVLDTTLGGKASGPAALSTLSDIHLNRVRTVGDSRPVYTITKPKAQHLALLKALDMSHLVDDPKVRAKLTPR